MSDLIERNDAIKAVCEGCLSVWKTCQYRWDCPALTNLMKLPSADRLQGEWIDDGLDAIGAMGVEYRWHKCSQCGFRISKSPSVYYPNFCEACGARMKGEDNE